MFRALRPFFITLVCSWLALFAAAYFYSEQQQSHWIMTAALPAFLVEAVFYLGVMFESTREWFAFVVPRRWQPLVLWISALLPYLIFAGLAGVLQHNAFLLLALFSAVLAYWHALLPRRIAYDVGFLVVAAAPVILRVFPRIYPSLGHLRIDILGHLMVIRLAVAALLVLREWQPGPIGMWPQWKEWRSGAIHYLIAVVPLCTLAIFLRLVHFEPVQGPWWRILGIGIGLFFGYFWVTAFSEELFFRGVLERAMLDRWRSPLAAIVLSALLFGSVHLAFRQFPDWQWALIATGLGLVCGSAYARTGSIRAPMVTHALVITTWKLLFR